MDIQSFKEVIPKDGKLSARIFENKSIGIEANIFFDIEIPLETFSFSGEEINTVVSLEFIQIDIKNDWKEIIGENYEFPVNPDDGYIDGSVYLGHVHNPADAISLQFKVNESDELELTCKVIFDFEYEGPGSLGHPEIVWTIKLNYDEFSLDQVIKDYKKLA